MDVPVIMSSGYTVNMTDEVDLGNGQHARVFPIPATIDLTLKWKINSGSLSISISDLAGENSCNNSDAILRNRAPPLICLHCHRDTILVENVLQR